MARAISPSLRRAFDIAGLVWRNRPKELADQTSASEEKAHHLACDLERLGPTFVKLGQLLSTRPDLMPPAYIRALSQLQDHVAGFPVKELFAIVERELHTSISSAFSWFDETPLAAASLSQVHRAALRDGRQVVVKVQRPGIRSRIDDDMGTLERVAVLLDEHTIAGRTYEFSLMLDEFRASLLRELDFGIEAKNLDALRASLQDFPDLVVPCPYPGLSTARVLTMDFIAGEKITSLHQRPRAGFDGQRLAEQLFRAYLKQILIDGMFHADPHPGNVLVTDDNKVALIDLGMVAFLSPGWRDGLFRLLLSLAEGRSEDVVDLCLELAEITDRFDEGMFRISVSQIVARQQNASVSEANMGQLVIDITRAATSSGMRVPSELTMLGKMMLSLDDVARTLAPDFTPSRAIERHATELMEQRVRKQISPAHLFEKALEVNELVERMPVRVNRILDALAHDRFKVKVDAIDEKVIIHGLQKLANRVTVGLIDAALIIGSAMMMRVESRWHIFGYPALAVLFFLAAAAGGITLVVDVLLKDENAKHKKKKARRIQKPQFPSRS